MKWEAVLDVVHRGGFPVEVSCPECGHTMKLWFNGGELDEQTCVCNKYKVSLTYNDILVRFEKRVEE